MSNTPLIYKSYPRKNYNVVLKYIFNWVEVTVI
jgi:hypothetical protein